MLAKGVNGSRVYFVMAGQYGPITTSHIGSAHHFPSADAALGVCNAVAYLADSDEWRIVQHRDSTVVVGPTR